MEDVYEVIIIGAGPAGMTAGMYSVRSGLKTLILEKGLAGGMVNTIPIAENYPGFNNISGMELVTKFKEQTQKYTEIHELEEVESININDKIILKTENGEYKTQALIFATGTSHPRLGVEGEGEFSGKGVSYCATCDGFFFKDKKVLVVGGGNTAVMEAIYLKNLGCDVFLIHRRDELRAEKCMKDRISENEINLILNSTIEKISGEDMVKYVKIRNLKDNSITDLKFDGVFVAIGEVPNNKLAKEIGIKLDNKGYVITDNALRTNIPRIYACGDLTGGIKQIVVGCSEGAIASLSAFEDLKNPYWCASK